MEGAIEGGATLGAGEVGDWLAPGVPEEMGPTPLGSVDAVACVWSDLPVVVGEPHAARATSKSAVSERSDQPRRIRDPRLTLLL